MNLFRCLLACLLLVSATTTIAAEQTKYRVLLQVDENSVDKMRLTLNTASNIQEQFGPDNVEVEIVVFSDGVETLKYYAPIPIADKVEEVTTEGVRIVVCELAMRSHKLTPSHMLQQVRYVPSGVSELVEKQYEGWAYIRP